MTPTEPGRLFLALIAGLVLGGAYFGGLYLTVQRLARSSSPKLLLTVSFGVRLLMVLLAFYLLSAWGIWAMMIAMGGFMLARLLWLGMHFVGKKQK